MITKERAESFSKILSADEERARRLMGLEPDTALKEINGLGYDFTLDEIKEYGTWVRDAQKNRAGVEELELDTLNEVAGGVTTLFGLPIVPTCIIARPPTSIRW